MAWDTTKNPGDQLCSGDWNSMVSDQKDHNTRHEVGGSDAVRTVITVGPDAPLTPVTGQAWLDTS